MLSNFFAVGSFADDKPSARSPSYQTYPSGSPEAVVVALMEYDYRGVGRHNPDYYYVLWPLLEVEDEPADECPISFVIDSYRVVGRQSITSGTANVRVEVNMLAMYTSGDALKKVAESKCNWPETVAFIQDGSTGRIDKFEHDLSARNVLQTILGQDADIDPILNTSGHWRLIPIPRRRSKWQFDVGLIQKNGKWVLSLKALPVDHRGLSSEIGHTKRMIKYYRERIEICEGKRPPKMQPLEYYKKTQCLPASDPAKYLRDELAELNALLSIKGESK
jgi:hypothetical protein